MSSYTPTIGLEIHAELKTRTKMFCDSANDSDEREPNVNICPICMGHPGTLPVINKEAVRHVLRVGTALGGTIADFTEFDRKNYFYPDIPKNYQISQYKYPLISGGTLQGVQITRIHLEEDTARSSHAETGSLVDFNRAGVPLMELVTEPVIHDAETAVAFARELRLLLRALGASEANLEKGEMRIEANISIAPKEPLGLNRDEGAVGPTGSEKPVLGTKVEVKNLNSFRAVEQAIAYELKRQEEVLEKGEKVIQETRGWDEAKQKTFSQRLKEESHDYRYFPDPDLPKLVLSELTEFSAAVLTQSLPELPWQQRTRYTTTLSLSAQVTETILQDAELSRLFEEACKNLMGIEQTRLAANYLTSDVVGQTSAPSYSGKALSTLGGADFAAIVRMNADGELSSRGTKDLITHWLIEGGDPKVIAKSHGLTQMSGESEIAKLTLDILAANEVVVAEYRAGKTTAFEFLLGQGMKLSKGSANPEKLRTALKNALEAK